MSDAPKFKPNRLLYILFAVGGGIFGVHNFYAGRKKYALFQLLLSLLSCGILAGITLVTVLADIFCYDTAEGKFRKTGLLWTFGCIFLIFLLPALGIYALYRHNLKQECSFNIVNIKSSLQMYAQVHKGKLPVENNDAGLLELWELNISGEKLICPISQERKYVYLGGANVKMGRCPVFFELPEGHSQEKTTVIYADGSLEVANVAGCNTAADVLEYLEKNAADEKIKLFLRRKYSLFAENHKR